MLRPTTSRRAIRRGNILIVTLALLALMAVVGITAVYYTKDQAERARIQGQPKGGGEGFSNDGTSAASAFLSALIYDKSDSGVDLLNSVRGHSLMATMYGRITPGNLTPTQAWTGPGTFSGATSGTFSGIDSRQLVNFRLFPGMGSTIRDPEHATERTIPTAAVATDYYGKNAAYTYPDVKDFYLASICPATGEVLVPSFHRNTAKGFGPLDPSNPNWLLANPQGKFLTLRPRPADHPGTALIAGFPPVPQNPDGTYTGDVQNLPGGFSANGVGKPDSIWIDTGLAPITLPNGNRVKPLIAALIVDLDGRVNLSIHGNALNGGTAHGSGNGFGAWEVSLEKALGYSAVVGSGGVMNATYVNEARQIVNFRGTPQRRDGGATSANSAFAASRYPALAEIQQSSQVAWRGFSGPAAPPYPLQLPGTTPPGDLFRTAPTYVSGYSGSNDSTNVLFKNHPSLYNPTEWPTTAGSPRAFPVSDAKILTPRYAPYPFQTSQLSIASVAPTTFVGTTAIASPNPPPSVTPIPTAFRTDASHAIRQIVTPYAYSLDRVGWMPGMGLGSDPNAVLGPIDLNRTLADYRQITTTPLSSTNIRTDMVPENERQQFAMDIFVRLVAVCANPADATVVAGTVTLGAATTTGTAGMERMRTLAQIAVNIVDYIDNDDISTRFTWNAGGASLGDQVVFGVEKPRLVINEAYSEVTNDPGDPALMDKTKSAGSSPGFDGAQVRFWVELQNPTMTPYLAATGPLGDGSVSFDPTTKPYRLEIVRNDIAAAPNVINRLRQATPPPSPDPNYASNVAGDLGAPPDVIFDFSPAAAGLKVPPSNGVVGTGFVVCAAQSTASTIKTAAGNVTGPEYVLPASVTPVIQGTALPATAGVYTTLAYTIPLNTISTPNTDVPAKLPRHVIALRRLANPYLVTGPNNPYVTVDVLDHVRSADRIVLPSGKTVDPKTDPNMPRQAQPTMADGFEANPQSVGKVQPYASYADPTQPTTTATKITSYPAMTMVVQQSIAGVMGNTVQETFGRANYKTTGTPPAGPTTPPTDTMVAPFDWLVHMDRPLINQLELLHISVGKPFDLTTYFVGPNNVKNGGSAQARMLLDPNFAQLYRALDTLRVQPYGQQTAFGGRVPGRININTIQDIRVWRALFDAQGYNGYTATDVDNWWSALMATRTTNMSTRTDATAAATANSCPVPGMSVYDDPTGTDRPFMPFNVPTAPTGGTTYAGGTGIGDTLLRFNPAVVTAQPGTPLNWPYLSVQTQTHPYQKMEAVQKILNNTTTVSHTFAVWITVGYFEVTSEVIPAGWPAGVPAPVQLGKEYYLQAPGDTRKKFFAVVDRSNVGIDPASIASGSPTHSAVRPFFTTLESSVAPPASPATAPAVNSPAGTTSIRISTAGSATLVSDGVQQTFAANSKLVIGVGANQEIVTVSAVPSFVDGVSTVTISALTKNHYVGECVSNVIPGNPGPQPGFDVTLDMYKPVVPLWVKIP